jgi:hypothetical protein
MRDRYGPMLARGATTLWESFEPSASLCHGFSATPVYQLSTEVLGVAPLEPGCTRLRIAPQPVDLDWARGVVPTVRGDVDVAWQPDGESLQMDVTVPDGVEALIHPPPGYERPNARDHIGPGRHQLIFKKTLSPQRHGGTEKTGL